MNDRICAGVPRRLPRTLNNGRFSKRPIVLRRLIRGQPAQELSRGRVHVAMTSRRVVLSYDLFSTVMTSAGSKAGFSG